MKKTILKMAFPSTAIALILSSGCTTPVIHNVRYDLNPHVAQASARDSMKPNRTDSDIAISCVGPRAETNNIAQVSFYHCENPPSQEKLGMTMGGVLHFLQTPDPIGTYVERAAGAALASKGVRNNPESRKKLVIDLERFDYDENSDRKKVSPIMMPWAGLSADGVVRKGLLDATIKVVGAEGNIAYQRRVSLEVARKRGQASSTALIASVAIAQVSPITINPNAVREKEEKTVTADVLADLFAKFQDELSVDDDLLQAIRK